MEAQRVLRLACPTGIPRTLVHRFWLPTPSGHSGGEAKRTYPPQSSQREAVEKPWARVSPLPPPPGLEMQESVIQSLMAQVVKTTNKHSLPAPEGKNKYASASHGWQTLNWHPIQMTRNPRLNPHLSWRESAGARTVIGGPKAGTQEDSKSPGGLTPVTPAWGWEGIGAQRLSTDG